MAVALAVASLIAKNLFIPDMSYRNNRKESRLSTLGLAFCKFLDAHGEDEEAGQE